MAIRRSSSRQKKLALALYKKAAKHQTMANYLYKLAQEANEQAANEQAAEAVAVPAAPQASTPPAKTTPSAPEKQTEGDKKQKTKIDVDQLSQYLPGAAGAFTGANVGGLAAGGLARLFLGDEEKARKWVLLSALLGAAAGGLAGGYGMSALMASAPPAPPATEAAK